MRALVFNDNNKIVHKRVVMNYMDWLGVVGGMQSLLYSIFVGYLVNSYSNFNSIMEILNDTNLFKLNNKKTTEEYKDNKALFDDVY